MTTGVPYFPQSLAAGTIVGRLSTNPGPTEAIPIATLASALGIGAASLIITGVAGTNTITGVTTGAPALAANQTAWFIPAATNTGATTLNRDGLGAKNLYYNGGACVGGELIIGVPAIVFYDGTKYNLQSVPNTYSTTVSTPRSYLAGLTLSTAGGSGTMSIAAGFAVDSTNVYGMSLSAFTKTTSSWALGTGNGGLDTGTIANSTWYYFYLIQRVDTKVVDVIFSLSASVPTYPANYTVCRRIGEGLTDGSAHWISVSTVQEFPVNALSAITNSLSGDVALNNTANYFTGPTVAQGTVGTWFVTGKVCVSDSSAAAIYIKLWDGTTVIDSATVGVSAGGTLPATLSGYISSPAGNLRISVKDATNTTGSIVYNNSSNGKDSTITAIRIG